MMKRLREVFFGTCNRQVNDLIGNKVTGNEVRTAMKDGIWRTPPMFRFAHLALVAVLAVMLSAGSLFAAVCQSTGDFTLGSGEQLTTSVGGTAGIAFTVGDTVVISFKVPTANRDAFELKVDDSLKNKILDKVAMTETGHTGGFYTYSYSWNTGGANVDFYAVEVSDANNGNYKAGGFVQLGSPATGMWFYSDAARTNQTDTFGNGDTVYATVTVTNSDNQLKKVELNDYFGTKVDVTASTNVTQTGTTWQFSFPADFAGAGIANGDWGFVKWQANNINDRVQRTLKRDDTYTNAVPCVETPPCVATAPSDLAANAPSSTQVNLTWTYDGTNNDYYTIFRDGAQIATNITVGSYTDATAAAGTTYSYTVRGHNTAGACDSADSNTANVTTPTCTELTPSSISFNGTTSAAGDFTGSSFVTPVDLTSLEFRVTEGSFAPPFTPQTDDFSAASGGDLTLYTAQTGWTNWIGVNGSDGTNSWCYADNANGTASGGTGTVAGNPRPWIYLEASANGQNACATGTTTGSSQYLESNVKDASQYSLTFNFDYMMDLGGTNADAELHLDAWNGTSWVADVYVVANGMVRLGDGGAQWYSEGPIDLSAYTNADFKLRFRYVVGTASGYQNDISFDNLAFTGTPRSSEVERLAWNLDPQEATAVLTTGNSYNLYARGTDPECGTVYYVGGTALPGTSQSFTWSSCTETSTLTAPVIAPSTTPITGAVTVTAGGTATGIQVSWSEDGGTSWSAWVANGSTYTPTSCITGNVIFRAQGTGDCGILNAQTAATAFDTTDKDLATLTTSDPNPATGVVTLQTAVGVETTPATMSGMQVSVAGSSACNVAAAAMTWNAGTTRWEYSWDTSACGTAAVENNITIDVNGSDPDCSDAVSAPQITAVSIDNTCTDATPSSIVIPPSQTVGGSTVDLTTLFSIPAPGNATGFTYKINGATVTSPWDSTAFGTTGPQVVTFEVTGTDPDCGGSVVGPTSNSISVNNALDTAAGVVQVASKNKSVDISAPYSGDFNTDNTLTVEWGTCPSLTNCDSTSFPNTSGVIAHAASPYGYSIPGLTNGQVYQVRVTYIDAVDGVTGNAVQIFTDQVPSNSMLHNSAATGSSKWNSLGGWGLAGAKYGEFTCDTCHVDTTTNIKRIRQTISFPDGSTMPNGAISSAVTLTDTRDTTSDYGDAVGGHTASSGVCEVCHSLDETRVNGVQHHAFDMSAATATNQNHQLSTDCMNCHNHKQGFKPTACDACHGNPPTTADADGSTQTGLAWSPVVTGSVTPGAHDAHVNVQGYTDCNTCHNGNAMPNGGDIDIHFNADFSAGGGGTSVTGTYSGQTGVNYNNGSVAGDGTKTCAAVYCHGGSIGGSGPVWDAAVVCGDCHGATAVTPPSTSSHATHAGTLALACNQCHGATAGAAGHMNGNVQWDVSALPTNAAGSATYAGTTTGNTGGLAPSAVYGNCSNVYCHFTSTPTWGGALSNGCASCHNNGAGEPWPSTGAHNAHFTALGVSLSTQVNNGTAVQAKCDYCHTGNTHADGTVQVSVAATYDDLSAGTPAYTTQCSNISCHGGQITPAWTGTIDANTQCTSCHKAESVATEYNSATSGMHGITGVVSGQNHGSSVACTSCHNGQPANHFSDTGLASSAMNRPAVTDFVAGITLGTSSDLDTCAMSCHKEGLDASRGVSTPWARLNNKTWASGGGAAGDECKTCHGIWGSWRANVLVNHANDWDTDGTPEVQANHAECETCHGFAPGATNANYTATWGTGDHGNGLITMNGPTPSTGAGYNSTNWGCDNACHGGASTSHNLADSSWGVGFGDFGGGSCDLCHAPGGTGPTVVYPAGNSGFTGELYGSHLKAVTADVVNGTTDWSLQCQKCHGFHSGDVQVANNTTVGINYTTHGGIWLGGTATGAKTTEAEICWTCHDINGISEWGLNTDTNGAYPDYNFGQMSTGNSNWLVGTWQSANFTYKEAAIQSTHTVNAAGSSAVTGAAYGRTESPDAVAKIRCSYCHDVHNRNQATSDTMTGKPYLRGSWFGNPYFEDGAPQNLSGSTTFETTTNYNRVPRGSISEDFFNASSQAKGGYWIDQNMTAQGVGTYPVSSNTAYDTVGEIAGLCTLCHGTSVNTMDYAPTGDNMWVGTNGHANAVIGGTGTASGNATDILDRSANEINSKGYTIEMGHSGGDGANYDRPEGYGYRDDGSYTPAYAPSHGFKEPEPYKNNWFEWGFIMAAGDQSANPGNPSPQLVNQYHQFTCSKCHNPHASRLPKLMITNCLDTQHNSWDDATGMSADTDTSTQTPSRSDGWRASNWSTSQNCHRVGAVGELGRGGDGLGDMDGKGWNTVTPW